MPALPSNVSASQEPITPTKPSETIPAPSLLSSGGGKDNHGGSADIGSGCRTATRIRRGRPPINPRLGMHTIIIFPHTLLFFVSHETYIHNCIQHCTIAYANFVCVQLEIPLRAIACFTRLRRQFVCDALMLLSHTQFFVMLRCQADLVSSE